MLNTCSIHVRIITSNHYTTLLHATLYFSKSQRHRIEEPINTFRVFRIDFGRWLSDVGYCAASTWCRARGADCPAVSSCCCCLLASSAASGTRSRSRGQLAGRRSRWPHFRALSSPTASRLDHAVRGHPPRRSFVLFSLIFLFVRYPGGWLIPRTS